MINTHANDSAETANEELTAITLAWQDAYQRWLHEPDAAQRAVFDHEYHVLAERLYVLLRDDLLRHAARWRRSGIAPDSEALALNMFAEIFTALPRIVIDPTRNVRNLLLVIARRGIADQYRRQAHRQQSQVPLDLVNEQVVCGTSRNDAHENHLLDALERRTCLEAISEYWNRTLTRIDLTLVTLRLAQVSFQEIAGRFNHRWGEAALRQRYSRIIRRTRSYLCDMGFSEV